jgi:hypothetical protein
LLLKDTKEIFHSKQQNYEGYLLNNQRMLTPRDRQKHQKSRFVAIHYLVDATWILVSKY